MVFYEVFYVEFYVVLECGILCGKIRKIWKIGGISRGFLRDFKFFWKKSRQPIRFEDCFRVV